MRQTSSGRMPVSSMTVANCPNNNGALAGRDLLRHGSARVRGFLTGKQPNDRNDGDELHVRATLRTRLNAARSRFAQPTLTGSNVSAKSTPFFFLSAYCRVRLV